MAWNADLITGTPAYQIASDTNNRVRVVAGPGTGKSFAMKRRVGRLLEEGVEPNVILPVTFTRVAAEDLHREMVGMGVPRCDELNGTTLHSLALRRLSRNAVIAATGRVARPLNDFELKPMIADLMRTGLGMKRVKELQQAYEAAWARLQHDQPGYALDTKDTAFQVSLLSWLTFHDAMLIGEVIPMFYQYLTSNPAAQERSEFAHILVDEFQDLNKAEQGVICLLSDNADVCIVGDDDQSIYSFKHAHPEGIRDWMVANAGASDIGLVVCRRCPTQVVEMARSLIQCNANRPVPRPLKIMRPNGNGDVRILQFRKLTDEVAEIAATIKQFVNDGTPPGDILVLAQSRAVGTPIYEALLDQKTPAHSEYSESELGKIEAQRAFALFKLLVDRTDRVALRWLVGVGGPSWNAAGYERVRNRSENDGSTPWEVLEKLRDGTISLPHTARVVLAFSDLCAELDALDGLANIPTLIDELFPDGQQATRDIRWLALELWAEDEEVERVDFVSKLVKAISQPEIPDQVDQVRIMSLHKSKGLSAPVTIVAGCVEGLLPRRPKDGLTLAEQTEQLEEQRRLFFVGITRVKADPGNGKPGTLIITYSQKMPVADALGAGITPAQQVYSIAVLQASRFIGELGPAAPAPIAG